jgi:hypothetical protein
VARPAFLRTEPSQTDYRKHTNPNDTSAAIVSHRGAELGLRIFRKRGSPEVFTMADGAARGTSLCSGKLGHRDSLRLTGSYDTFESAGSFVSTDFMRPK